MVMQATPIDDRGSAHASLQRDFSVSLQLAMKHSTPGPILMRQRV